MSRLDQIVVERATVVSDDYGADTQTWTPYYSGFADVLMGSGQERREAAQERASQTATFILVWSPLTAAIRPSDRVQFEGVWDVTGVAEGRGFRRQIQVTAVRFD